MTDSRDLLLLVTALAEQGFHKSGERLIAPHGTLWISPPMLEYAGIEGLRYEARRRLARARRQRKLFQSEYDWDCALEDAESLMQALDEIPPREELEAIALAS